ncbi:hypothetical protein [Sphingobium sp. Ant17]|uniref:hypothetical protein n=1 Tax=Sphingobium sp. Ant17 TaxID=1461752 RepID=UPI0004ADF565|nr:hypothetical protein [Sphingobium sp. Ant17]
MMLKAIDEIVGVFPRVAVIEGEGLEAGEADDWTCNGFVPVTYLIMPPWLRTRAG